MKIVFFARRFYPQIGGVEKHVMEISKRLVKKNHRVIVITEDHEANRTIEQSTIHGIEVIRIPVGRDDKFKKFRIWKSLWNVRDVIKDADIIHCHDVFFWYLPFRLFYPRKSVYTTFHGYESYPIRRGAIMMRKLSELLSEGNICIGDFITKWYGTNPTFVSYGAVDIPSSQYNLSRSKKESALFFGRLDEQTGSLEYTKAVQIIKKSYPKFDFLVIGEGQQRKQIEKVAKVIGFQKNPEKYFQEYRFAFVSRYLSILEAFAAKRLVFAVYDNPVKEDYLRMAPYTPWIVIAGNAEELADQVVYFLGHPEEEKKLVEKAYLWVQKQTWEEMAKIYLNLWEKE